MATDVAPIVVPREAEDAAGQQHTPTAAHTPVSPMPMSPGPLSPVLSPKLPKPTDPEELAAAIRKQVEFYFSDANLPTDKHLLKQIHKDPDGYVPLKMIANFKRVKGLTKELSVVTDALKTSTMLSVDEEGSRVRRTTPLPAYDTNDICRRTVVAEHLPDKPTIESVTQLFAQYGGVAMVRICSRGSTGKLPSWLNKAVEAINISLGHGEFALVEFQTEEECVNCVTKTKNPDNWRTSLRVRHLLPNFKPASKGRAGRISDTGSSHDGSHGHHQHGHLHAFGNHSSSGGGSSKDGASMAQGSSAGGSSAVVYQPPSRRSLDFQQHIQHGNTEHVPSDPASSSGASAGGSGEPAAAAAAAAAAATAGLAAHLTPIRTQPASSGGGKAASQGGAAAAGRLPGSPSAAGISSPAGIPSPLKIGSPMKGVLGGIGGSIGSPRTVKSPAPPEVASLIDNILAAPTGTPTREGRNSSSGRWSSGSGLGIEVDRSSTHLTSHVSSPAAAVAAALAGVITPPQSGSPRASSSTSGGARMSTPGGLGTPTRMSAAGAAAAAAAAAAIAAGGSSSGGGSCPSPVQATLPPHIAAQAAAAASCALTSSPKASNAASWRSSGNTPTSSMPGTPLANTCGGSVLSISAGAAVAAALEACSPPAGASGAFTVGSPNLSGGGASKAVPWVGASRLAYHQRMAAAQGSSDGGSSAARSGTPDGDDSWRSGGGNRPPRGPRVSMPSSGGGSSASSQHRRRSWHATEAEAAALAEGATAPAAEAAAAAADGSNSDSGSSARKQGRQSSRLGQGGDYHATIEAIREASCELDSGAVGRAIAAYSKGSGPSSNGSAAGVTSGAQELQAVDEGAEGDGTTTKRRRSRHRRSRSSGSRRQSLDDARPHSLGDHVGSAGVGAVGLSPRGGSRPGMLAPDEVHARHQQHHHGGKHASGGGGTAAADHHHQQQQRNSSAGGHGHGHEGNAAGKKKLEKKDYASWAAATPAFRAEATAAKSGGGGTTAGAPGGAVLSSSPVRGGAGVLSPMRGQGVAAPGAVGHHGHHLEHTARGPDGTRGFTMGRGRPLTPAAL